MCAQREISRACHAPEHAMPLVEVEEVVVVVVVAALSLKGQSC